MSVPLQPLRIPTGWHVEYNNGLYEIDPLSREVSAENQWLLFKEDMLQLKQPHFNRLLDLGWYPEGDMVEGCYRLVVYNGDFRGQRLHQFQTRDRATLVAEIERLLEAICRGQL